MNRRIATCMLAIALSVPFALVAHDSGKHKGKPTMGKISSIADKELSIETKSGVKTVTLTEKTKFLDGEKPTKLSMLKTGDDVTVHGTTLASGAIVAEEITKGMSSSDGMKMGGMKMGGMEGHDHQKMKAKP